MQWKFSVITLIRCLNKFLRHFCIELDENSGGWTQIHLGVNPISSALTESQLHFLFFFIFFLMYVCECLLESVRNFNPF